MCTYDISGQAKALVYKKQREDTIKQEIITISKSLYLEIKLKVPGLRNIEKKEAIDTMRLFFDDIISKLDV